MHLTSRRLLAVTTLILATAAMLSPTWLSARMIVGGFPDLNRMVESSDTIVQGEVVEVTTEWIDRRIQTTYRIRADRYLKGRMGAELEITLPGGAVHEPFPLAMIYDGMVVMSENQDVVLFLQDPPVITDPDMLQRAAALPPALVGSMQVTLGDLGVFTVVEDEETGEQLVSRLSYGSGSLVTPDGNRQVLEAAADALVASRDLQAQAPWMLRQELLETGELIRDSETGGNRPVTVRNLNGETIPLPGVTIPSPTVETPRRSTSSTITQLPMSVSRSSFRSLDDFLDEVTDLVNEGDR